MKYFRLRQLTDDGIGDIDSLPYSIRVLLEACLRNVDGFIVSNEDVTNLASWNAAAPAQVEILAGSGVTDQSRAAEMLPVGLSTVQRNIVTRLSKTPEPPSQAQLARDLGRSRASVHSAIGVLRQRGILCAGRLALAPHLSGLRTSQVDYPWLDVRVEYA